MRMRFLWVVPALGLFALAWWVLAGSEERDTLAPPEAIFAPPAAGEALETSAPHAARESVAESGERAAETVTPAPTDAANAAPSLALRGRVVDASARPLAGARLELVTRESDGYQGLDLELRARSRTLAESTSDAEGRFAFELDEQRLLRLRVGLAGFAERELSDLRASRDAEDELLVVLERAASLRGRVTRSIGGIAAAGGEPAAGVRVHVFGGRLASRETVTDASGTYAFSELPPETCFLEAVPPPGSACSGWIELAPVPGESLEIDLVLTGGVRLHGTVRDARTGFPIAGAEVGESWTFQRSVRTEVDGRYEFPGLSESYAGVTVRAAGYGNAERSFWQQEHGDSIEWDFALEPARRARGRVVDASGRPLAGVYVAAAASEHTDDSQQTDWIAGRTDGEGRFLLEGLRPDLRHALVARSPGHGAVVYDFPAAELELAEVELGTVVLPAPGRVRGSVLDELERPHSGLGVTLVGTNQDRARLRPGLELESWSIDLYVAERATRTDGFGRFGFDDVAPGSYRVRLSRGGGRAELELAVEVLAGEVSELPLRVERGGSISGRVVATDGGPLPALVELSFEPEGSGNRGQTRVASDGSFRADGLTGERYALRAFPYVDEEDERQLVGSRLAGIAAGEEQLVLFLRPARRVSGSVLDADGAPVAGASVFVLDRDGHWLDGTRCDAVGGFRLRILREGGCELVAQPPRLGGASAPPGPESRFRVDASAPEPLELRLDWRP